MTALFPKIDLEHKDNRQYKEYAQQQVITFALTQEEITYGTQSEELCTGLIIHPHNQHRQEFMRIGSDTKLLCITDTGEDGPNKYHIVGEMDEDEKCATIEQIFSLFGKEKLNEVEFFYYDALYKDLTTEQKARSFVTYKQENIEDI